MRASLLVFLIGVATATPGSAQDSAVRPDSSELRSRAGEAQRRFEAFHRRQLPVTDESWGGDCDERIGRICLRFQGGSDWEPVPEDSALAQARAELLDTLDEIGSLLPGDRWILAQRIRYLGDEGRWREAMALARQCAGGPGWWCPGLQGYVHHRSGRSVEALVSFERALASMREERASRWMDPADLLDPAAVQWLKGPPPGLTEAEARDRVWALADPLYLSPGNSRLSEHLTRRFGALLYADATQTMTMGWSGAHEELLIRYGFPAGWERVRPGMGDLAADISVVEHHHPDSRGLMPPLEALDAPGSLPEGVWVPEDRAPRSGSAPLEAPLILEGDGQAGLFRRGDSILVVAAFAPPSDTLLGKRRPPREPAGVRGSDAGGTGRPGTPPPWEPSSNGRSSDTLAGLFLLPVNDPDGLFEARSRGGRGVIGLMAPPGSYLLSLETWYPAGRWASRLRHGIEAEPIQPDVPVLSDFVLLDSADDLPETLAQASSRLQPSVRVRSGGRVTLGWEVYGLGRRREPLTFSVSLQKEEASLLRRAFERVGLFRRDPALSLEWTEGGVEALGPLFRAVDVDLPELDPGWYILQLELNIPNRTTIRSVRRIHAYRNP